MVPGEERGQRTINDAEAAVVCRIFADYGAGKSPKAIAAALNKEGILSPSGKGWGQSTINGNRQRGTGILNSELYIGRLVWNRLRNLKDPETGKRVSKMNPEDAWIMHDVPDLRIVSEELWEKAKSRQAGLNSKPKLWQTKRPRNIFAQVWRVRRRLLDGVKRPDWVLERPEQGNLRQQTNDPSG